MRLPILFGCVLLAACHPAHADVVSPLPTRPAVQKQAPQVLRPLPQAAPMPISKNPRDPVSVARRTPAVALRIQELVGQGQGNFDEIVTVADLRGQCGIAGCSSTHVVVFTYKTKGANTATSSVVAAVHCPPIQSQACQAGVAEVRALSQPEQSY